MRALVLAVLAGCYSPELAPCSVTCGSDSPCPADLSCGSDGFCRAGGETATCSVTLTVTTNSTGDGRVTSSPNGVDCSTHANQPCLTAFAPGTRITLTAQRFNGTGWSHWSGDACDGSPSSMCTFTLDTAMTVQASFR